MRLTSMLSGSLLALTLALTGCGGDDSDDESGSDNTSSSNEDSSENDDDSDEPDQVDVCALITTADLEEVFGSPFDEGELIHQDQTGGDQCTWSNQDAPPVKVFSITVLRDGHFSEAFEENDVTAKSLYEDTKEYSPDAEDIDGLGDEAYLAGSQLAVLDGGSYWTFSSTGTSAEAIAGTKTLAEKVIG